MKKVLLIFTTALPLILFGCGRSYAPLTEEQRVEDFLYLYEAMNDNYPYFELRLRQCGLDWPARKEIYMGMVRDAQSDTAHVSAIGSILRELHDGHADIFPTIAPDLFGLYIDIVEKSPEYMPWKESMEKQRERLYYWSGVYNADVPQIAEDEDSPTPESGYKDTVLVDRGIAVMRVPSLDDEFILPDRPRSDRFLENLSGVKALIIDIQGNGGGNTGYWMENIVSRLIRDTVRFAQFFALKPGEINRRFFARYFTAEFDTVPGEPFMERIPHIYREGSYRIVREQEEIAPRDPVGFDGVIYLLVDGSVFSSAEGFANFAQSTGWATVAGRRTAGDGVGSDPVIVTLPSGIKVRFPVTAGFNPDGSLNTEYGTMPDIWLEGETGEERLHELIDKID